MDKLGYSQKMVKLRRIMQEKKDESFNRETEGNTQVTAGSKGEGYSCYYENDEDILFIDKYRVCVLPCGIYNYPCTITVFTMHGDNCPPGYFRIMFSRKGSQKNCIDDFEVLCESKEGYVFIKERSYIQAISRMYLGDTGRGISTGTITGPSVPGERVLYKEDRVWAFRCLDQKDILREWIGRKRHYGWPPRELIKEISELEAQLVPVGCKGSEHKDLEWRVCFVPSELKLLKSFNETQYKLYIFLKFVKSSAFRPICEDLSYIFKNLVFWLVEENSKELFVPQNLLMLTVMALTLLHGYIEKNHLRYYMIPDRNLLAGRIMTEERSAVLKQLEHLICLGPTKNLVMECNRVGNAMFSTKMDELEMTSAKREKLEILSLRHINIKAKFFRSGYSIQDLELVSWKNKEVRQICYEAYDLVWPGWRHFLKHDLETDSFLSKNERQWFLEMQIKYCRHPVAELINENKHEFAEELSFCLDDLRNVTVERISNVIILALIKIEIVLASL